MRKKIAVIMTMLVLVVASLITTVSAASFTATITPSQTTVAESNEVVVTIRVSNLDVGTTGINVFEGVLSYSTQIFETINADSIEGTNGWQPAYNQDTGKISVYKQGFLNEDADIFQITFKTKTNVTGKTGEIKISDIKASNTGETIEAQSISTRITVGTPADNENVGNTSGNQANTTTNTNKSTINITRNITTNSASNTNRNVTSSYIDSTNNNNTNTKAVEEVPYTGASDNIMRAIFVVLVIAGISYFKYESIKEK